MLEQISQDVREASNPEGQGWDRDRVLLECAAKSRIADRHEPIVIHERGGKIACRCCGYGGEWPITWPCDTFLDLASVYIDRPGFPAEWKG